MAWLSLRQWAPFKIDALGLVTILGANELDLMIGSLCYNSLTEFLPLLASSIIASDQITTPIPGTTIYNITDGIVATDIAGWLTRWLLCQDFTWNSSTLEVAIRTGGRHRRRGRVVSAIIGITVMILVIVLTVGTYDWFGLANALGMTVSILVRWVVVNENRKAIDFAVSQGLRLSSDIVKTFWVLPNGKAITVYAPRGVIINCFLTSPRPRLASGYLLVRIFGWISFGVHIVTLGMACLVNQLIAVAILIISTLLTVWRISAERFEIGSCLTFIRRDHPDPDDSRSGSYVRLQLSYAEELCMLRWNLLPQPSNEGWWRRYRIRQKKERMINIRGRDRRGTV